MNGTRFVGYVEVGLVLDGEAKALRQALEGIGAKPRRGEDESTVYRVPMPVFVSGEFKKIVDLYSSNIKGMHMVGFE